MCHNLFSSPAVTHPPFDFDSGLQRDAIKVGNVQTDITEARAAQEFTCQPVHINGLIKNTDFLQDTEKLIKILFSRLNKLSITTYIL